jgi:hypothetical protein
MCELSAWKVICQTELMKQHVEGKHNEDLVLQHITYIPSVHLF